MRIWFGKTKCISCQFLIFSFFSIHLGRHYDQHFINLAFFSLNNPPHVCMYSFLPQTPKSFVNLVEWFLCALEVSNSVTFEAASTSSTCERNGKFMRTVFQLQDLKYTDLSCICSMLRQMPRFCHQKIQARHQYSSQHATSYHSATECFFKQFASKILSYPVS